MKNKIFYIAIFILFLGGLVLWNVTKSRNIEYNNTAVIDIDRFVRKNTTDTVNIVNDLIINFEEVDNNTPTWIHREVLDSLNQDTNCIYIKLVKRGSNYYYQTVVKYIGEEEIGLKNIYINSNLNSKAKILEVSNDNYTMEVNDSKYVESVSIETNASDDIFIRDYIEADTINIVFMGFAKNISWVLPDNQLKILKESYSYYNKLIK